MKKESPVLSACGSSYEDEHGSKWFCVEQFNSMFKLARMPWPDRDDLFVVRVSSHKHAGSVRVWLHDTDENTLKVSFAPDTYRIAWRSLHEAPCVAMYPERPAKYMGHYDPELEDYVPGKPWPVHVSWHKIGDCE
jgi:hypothetical protein